MISKLTLIRNIINAILKMLYKKHICNGTFLSEVFSIK